MISAFAMTADGAEAREPLVVGGDHVPGRPLGARRREHLGERLLVVVPVAALLDVRGRELPVVVGQVDAPQEADALLLLGEVEEQLHDGEPVVGEVALPVVDVAVALLPDVPPARLPGQLLVLEDLGVHAHHEDLLVVGAVEDADLAAARQVGGEAPQVVVVELQGRGRLVGVHGDALRVHAAHDVADGAVLAGGVERLQHDDDAVGVLRRQPLLVLAQQLDALRQELGRPPPCPGTRPCSRDRSASPASPCAPVSTRSGSMSSAMRFGLRSAMS